MNLSYTELREKRLQKLFDDCQKNIISQIIGPFGLSPAMFEDRNGGNVTTLHNFSRADADYVATKSDRILHDFSKQDYSESKNIRNKYEVSYWNSLKDEKISKGIDEYTGKPVYFKQEDYGKTLNKSGEKVGVDLDHIISINEAHRDPKFHLALGKVDQKSEADVSAISEMLHNDDNLALTSASINRSKKAQDLKDFSKKTRNSGETNAEHFGLDKSRVKAKHEAAQKNKEQTVDPALKEKYKKEIMQTGLNQAAKMGVRQALGVLLVELVNGLYNEFKILIKAGVEIGKNIYQEVKERLQRVIASVIKKIPDAISQFFQGGVSGFMSNLITFLINQFISTAKRIVTVIREGLTSLFKAFKMIMFPPKGMTDEQAFQEGTKILSATVITSIGIFLSEGVVSFVSATFPFLGDISGTASNVLIGIITGLISAFLAYKIDNIFEQRRRDERLLEAVANDAKLQGEVATELTNSFEASLSAIEMYAQSVQSYQLIGHQLAVSGRDAQATIHSLDHTLEISKQQLDETKNMTAYLQETHTMLDDFFKKV